jgi:hypothetical protein
MKNEPNENNEQEYESSWHKPIISKASLLELLKANGLPKTLSLRNARRQDNGVASVQNELNEKSTGEPALYKFDSSIINTLIPETLKQCPAWYIRLPQKWAADVPHLLLAKSFNAYCERDEENPWYICQYISLDGERLHDKWPQDARKLAIDDRFINDSINKGISSGAIVLLIECNERLSVTAVPIVEDLANLLQANDGSSFRKPLYNLSLAAVHSLVRNIEDGRKPLENQDLLRLPIISADTKANSHFQCTAEESTRRSPPAQVDYHERCIIGALSSVVGYLSPNTIVSSDYVLCFSLSNEIYEIFKYQPSIFKVIPLNSDAAGDRLVNVVLSSEDAILVAEISDKDEQVCAGFEQFSKSGFCEVVFENKSNGRWIKFTVPFPSGIGLKRNITNVLYGVMGYGDELDGHCEFAQTIIDITKLIKGTVKRVNCAASSEDGSYHHRTFMDYRHEVNLKRHGAAQVRY